MIWFLAGLNKCSIEGVSCNIFIEIEEEWKEQADSMHRADSSWFPPEHCYSLYCCHFYFVIDLSCYFCFWFRNTVPVATLRHYCTLKWTIFLLIFAIMQVEYFTMNTIYTLIHKTLIYCTVGLLLISLLILHIVNFLVKFVEFE